MTTPATDIAQIAPVDEHAEADFRLMQADIAATCHIVGDFQTAYVELLSRLVNAAISGVRIRIIVDPFDGSVDEFLILAQRDTADAWPVTARVSRLDVRDLITGTTPGQPVNTDWATMPSLSTVRAHIAGVINAAFAIGRPLRAS